MSHTADTVEEAPAHKPPDTERANPLAATPAHSAATVLALTAGAGLLSACGGGGGGPAAAEPLPGASSYRYTAASNDAEAARFLQQAQFSSTEAEIATLRRGSYADWLRTQFDGPMGQTGWDWLEERGYGANDKNNYFNASYPADFMVWKQLMTAPDAMRKRAALALSEYFVISLNASEFNWRSHAVASWWDMLARNAFGNFRQLLEDVSLHPAMGWFLNTKGNQKANENGRVPDENYAREVMQLFTIGLYELNANGTERLGANGQRIETYVQSDVTNLARVFTGYDFDEANDPRIPVGDYTVEARFYARRPMALDPDLHSTEEINFLGVHIPANTPGPLALRIALDRLFNHPNVGPFFGRQMIQRLVTSNPSPAYVARVAAAFNNNGAGVRGDLRAVWAAILLDDEARGPQGLSDPRFGKLRELMLRQVQWARSFGATSIAGTWKIGDTSSSEYSLGQSPLRAPSVFNYYRPGFVPPGTALASEGANAPEFQIVNETTVGSYINHMRHVIGLGIYVYSAQVPYMAYDSYDPDIVAEYRRQLQLANDPAALVNHLNLVLCAEQLTAGTQAAITGAVAAIPISVANRADDERNRVAAAIFLIMASAEYLVQK